MKIQIIYRDVRIKREAYHILIFLVFLMIPFFAPYLSEAGRGASSQLSKQIYNRAYAYYSIYNVLDRQCKSSKPVIIEIECHTTSELTFRQYAQDAGNQCVFKYIKTECYNADTGAFEALENPCLPGMSINSGSKISLFPKNEYHIGDPIFLVLKDLDQNADPLARETVIVTINMDTLNDEEILRLTETDPNSGFFVGYITTSGSAPVRNDGLLSVNKDSMITAKYSDIYDDKDVSLSVALIDPFGTVFDTMTCSAVDGVEVTLIDSKTGLPAIVLSEDGVSAYPSTVTTGGTVTDAAGRVYEFQTGKFWFPFIKPGYYRFELNLPPGYTYPSKLTANELQSLPCESLSIRPGSCGEIFEVESGPPLHIDIPVDKAGQMFIRKTASKDIAALGDVLQYRLRIEDNLNIKELSCKEVKDFLPQGFYYIPGSARINGAYAKDPALSDDGRVLIFTINDAPFDNGIDITYVIEVGAGASTGKVENTAVAIGADGRPSNVAKAVVEVREDFMRRKSIIMGKVTVEARDGWLKELEAEKDPGIQRSGPGDIRKAEGLQGVRIYMEDGTYVVTDKNGMYHFEGVEEGVHVIQLDVDTLPDRYRPIAEKNDRFACSAYSQFVDIKGGILWRADFKVEPRPLFRFEAGGADRVQDATVSKDNRHNQNIYAFNEAWLESAEPGREWLFPASGYLPSIPSVNVALKHYPDDRVLMMLDGERISLLNFEAVKKNEAGSVAVSLWRGIDLHEGDNLFEVIFYDANNTEIEGFKNTIHYSGIPVKAELFEEGSILIADGKTSPVIAVRLSDKDGYPAREAVIGEFSVDPPYFAKEEAEGYQNFLLSGLDRKRPRFVVEKNGLARIKLQPTTTSGEAVLRIRLANLEHEIRVWLVPPPRDWILVGLAEGTIGYNKIKKHTEALAGSELKDKFYQEGRAAFFAKGKIKGKWLLTASYDSAQNRDKKERDLYQIIDPDEYYTLYGDSTQQDYEAPSSERIYLKLEREQFYALFGDYDTGLTITELSRYNRTLNGLKTQMLSKDFGLITFASETNHAFIKDEISGNGTSGLYYLSRKNIIVNSEKVSIDVRDRFRSEIILSSRRLTRHIDYNIDYRTGTLFFRQPVMSRDVNFNPIYIVCDYESYDDADKRYNYGGRAALRMADKKVEIGTTHIHEGHTGGNDNLYGLDLTYNISKQIGFKSEMAYTDKEFAQAGSTGKAYLAEINHHSEESYGRLYIRSQDEGFGLGQQRGTEAGTKKLGADLSNRFSNKLSLDGKAYRHINLSTNAKRDVVEASSTYNWEHVSLRTGLLSAVDEFEDGIVNRSAQVNVGSGYEMFQERLIINLDHYQSLRSDRQNRDFPTRSDIGVDFKATSKITMFAKHEITSGEIEDSHNSIIGLKGTPWRGGEILTTLEQDITENGLRSFANLGLHQTLRINDRWSLDTGLEKTRTIQSNVNTHTVPSNSKDFTAVSLGAAYRRRNWSWTSRVERRDSDQEKKWGVFAGMLGEPRKGLGLSLGGRIFNTKSSDREKDLSGDFRLSLVYRPPFGSWMVLNRLDFLFENRQGSDFEHEGRRIVNNLNTNFKPNERVQMCLQYGLKYITETIGRVRYGGYTDFFSFEGRYDIKKWLDIGLRISILHSWNTNRLDYSCGPSIGFDVCKNFWVSAGYNITGFKDEDFSPNDFTAQGTYIQFRFKVDQEGIKGLRYLSKAADFTLK